MKICSNCGYQIPPDKSMCPNCGQPVAPNAAWPPEPNNSFVPKPPDPGTLITGSRGGDLTLGFISSWGLVLFGIGLLVMPILYFVLRTRYPTFARGIGFGLLSVGVILLGALAVCMGALVMSESGRHP